MMDKAAYSRLRSMSNGLFKNGYVLPVALATLKVAQNGETFKLAELREELGGRADENRIRGALKRIEACGAAQQLPSLGRPNPDIWKRLPHPLWDFAGDWVRHAEKTPKSRAGA